MSTQPEPDYSSETLSEQAIRDYLAENPDFFERYPGLLPAMDLPHASGGTISLVERQVSMLRQKELKLQRQLKDLIEVARDNDVLSAKIHELALQLMASTDLNATISATEEAMRSGFGADQSILVLFGDAGLFGDIKAGRFFRVVERDASELKPFATFLKSNTPRCGKVRDVQASFLFHDDADEIGSVALVPLGEQPRVGFLAIGSHDGDRFHPGMSIDFLARVGDLVAGALRRF